MSQTLPADPAEIRALLPDKVVTHAHVRDVDLPDLCMIMGAGWPFHLGGITPYLDRTGIAERVTGSRLQPA